MNRNEFNGIRGPLVPSELKCDDVDESDDDLNPVVAAAINNLNNKNKSVLFEITSLDYGLEPYKAARSNNGTWNNKSTSTQSPSPFSDKDFPVSMNPNVVRHRL